MPGRTGRTLPGHHGPSTHWTRGSGSYKATTAWHQRDDHPLPPGPGGQFSHKARPQAASHFQGHARNQQAGSDQPPPSAGQDTTRHTGTLAKHREPHNQNANLLDPII
jgi:hypothetical protein